MRPDGSLYPDTLTTHHTCGVTRDGRCAKCDEIDKEYDVDKETSADFNQVYKPWNEWTKGVEYELREARCWNCECKAMITISPPLNHYELALNRICPRCDTGSLVEVHKRPSPDADHAYGIAST